MKSTFSMEVLDMGKKDSGSVTRFEHGMPMEGLERKGDAPKLADGAPTILNERGVVPSAAAKVLGHAHTVFGWPVVSEPPGLAETAQPTILDIGQMIDSDPFVDHGSGTAGRSDETLPTRVSRPGMRNTGVQTARIKPASSWASGLRDWLTDLFTGLMFWR